MEQMVSKEVLIKYYKNLINSCFKLIPLYNGEQYKTRKVIYSSEEAFTNYQVYLCNLIVEMYGNSIFFTSDNSIKLLSILIGMIQQIGQGEHKQVKQLTMECINLCKKIIKEIELER